MAWYLAPSLQVLRAEVDTRWPRRDRASDGTIGDAAHAAGTSDHNPNSRESVNAIDIDKDGVTVSAILAAAERHPSVHYWIYNREIADRDNGFRRQRYTGSNPHDKHLHISIRQTRAAEQDRRPWGLLAGEDDDMSAKAEDQINNVYGGFFYGGPSMGRTVDPDGSGTAAASNSLVAKTDYALNRLDELTRKVDALAATPPGTVTIPDEQLERLLRKVIGSVDGASPQG